MPNLSVIRPADGNETNAAWRIAMEKTDQPTSLVLTRQKLPTITKDSETTYENVKKGAYTISPNEDAEAILIATRSEEHTSELQSRGHLVCRLLLEKKKTNT